MQFLLYMENINSAFITVQIYEKHLLKNVSVIRTRFKITDVGVSGQQR